MSHLHFGDPDLEDLEIRAVTLEDGERVEWARHMWTPAPWGLTSCALVITTHRILQVPMAFLGDTKDVTRSFPLRRVESVRVRKSPSIVDKLFLTAVAAKLPFVGPFLGRLANDVIAISLRDGNEHFYTVPTLASGTERELVSQMHAVLERVGW